MCDLSKNSYNISAMFAFAQIFALHVCYASDIVRSMENFVNVMRFTHNYYLLVWKVSFIIIHPCMYFIRFIMICCICSSA